MCKTQESLLMIIVFALTLVSPGCLASNVKLYVDPPSIVDYSYFPGVTFTINVSMIDVFDLRACKFNLSYNGGVLGCFGMLVGPSENEPFDIIFGWDDASGEIWFSVLYRVPLTSENPVTLSTIFFFVKGRGESPFHIYGCDLRDSFGNVIPCEVFDGYFSNFNPYDINSDGIVDMLDVSIAALAFGSYPGHPRWNSIADVNHDNYVDMLDLSLITRNFGKL
ncbi:MAG: hypothetical protein QW791_03195 [Candidatus Bathyarchaeia archaeon]